VYFGYYKIVVVGWGWVFDVTRYMGLWLGGALFRFLMPRRHCPGFAALCPDLNVGAHKWSAIAHFCGFANWLIGNFNALTALPGFRCFAPRPQRRGA